MSDNIVFDEGFLNNMKTNFSRSVSGISDMDLNQLLTIFMKYDKTDELKQKAGTTPEASAGNGILSSLGIENPALEKALSVLSPEEIAKVKAALPNVSESFSKEMKYFLLEEALIILQEEDDPEGDKELEEFKANASVAPKWVQKIGNFLLKNVFKVDPNDPEAIAGAIEQVMNGSNPAVNESPEVEAALLISETDWAMTIPHIYENLENIEEFVENNPSRLTEGFFKNAFNGIKANPKAVLKTLGSAVLPILLSVLATTLLGPGGALGVSAAFTLKRVLKATGGGKNAASIAKQAESKQVQEASEELDQAPAESLVQSKVPSNWRTIIFGAPTQPKYSEYLKQKSSDANVVSYVKQVMGFMKQDLQSGLPDNVSQSYNQSLQWLSQQPAFAA